MNPLLHILQFNHMVNILHHQDIESAGVSVASCSMGGNQIGNFELKLTEII